MQGKAWKEGEKTGKITILKRGDRDEHGYRHFKVQCECGEKFDCIHQTVSYYSRHGCPKCSAMDRARKKVAPYIGKTYGALEIIKYDENKSNARHVTCVVCKCKKCGNITSDSLAVVIKHKRSGCKKCGMTGLAQGRDMLKEHSVCGTQTYCLRFGKNANKNSTTGVNGVSLAKSGRYRAYINFQRKQYYLGEYDKIEDAAAARKIAEQKIYGDFLKWYKEHEEEVKVAKAKNQKTEYDPKIIK